MTGRLALATACVFALLSPRIALALDSRDRGAVVRSYRAVYLNTRTEAHGWTGGTGSCSPGRVDAAYLESALRRLNWFRAMAGLPAIAGLDMARHDDCQRAALIMSANRRLSHTPSDSWSCWSRRGADMAGTANLASGYRTFADAITGWIRDERTPTAGHRRWILYPPLDRTALGAAFVDGRPAYVMWTTGGDGTRRGSPEWVAWPPRGFVPYDVVNELWSFSMPKADFSRATVRMTRRGRPLEVRLHPVKNGYGDNALVWSVDDWPEGAPEKDVTYTVSVNGVGVAGRTRVFSYTVTIIDPQPPSTAQARALD